MAALLVPAALHAQGSLSVTVQLQSGDRVILHGARFDMKRGSERGVGRRGGAGTLPPEFQPGNTPGDVPGGGGRGGGGDPYGPGGGRLGREPVGEGGGFDSRPSTTAHDPLGIGLSERDYRNLRRIDILQAQRGRTTGDLLFVDGSTRQGVRMNWEIVTGWDKPRSRGQFYQFDADEILSIELPH